MGLNNVKREKGEDCSMNLLTVLEWKAPGEVVVGLN
jgi:hypothetical protein